MDSRFSSYNSNYIDNLLKNLHEPDIQEGEAPNSTRLNMSNIFGRINFTNLGRIKNKIFNDGTWYDEAKARQLVIDYINNPKCRELLKNEYQRIVQIYDRLVHISKNKGTWADGIDKELLLALEPTKNKKVLYELNEVLSGSVLVEEFAKEQIFEDKETIAIENKNDPIAQSYTFKPVESHIIPNEKLIFHIHADEFGNSSELEGGHAKEAVGYLRDYLGGKTNAKISSQASHLETIIDELANAIHLKPEASSYTRSLNSEQENLQKHIGKVKQKITESFEQQKSLLLMGGWTGRPSGHAIYYEIIPHSDQTATFRLYNTGAGIEHHLQAKHGNKLKYQSYSEWTGITKERLESPHFIEALRETNSYAELPEGSILTEYDDEDIYQGLQNLLQPKEIIENHNLKINPELMMSPQRSGVCSWRSLMAFMRTKLSLNDYKRFKCDIKLQSLTDYVKKHPGKPTFREWNLILKSHQNLCRAIVLLKEKGLVSDLYIQSVQGPLKDISNWIHSYAQLRYQRNAPQQDFSYALPTSDTLISNKHSLPSPLHEIASSSNTEKLLTQPHLQTIESLKQVNLKSPATIEESLGLIISQAEQAWAKQDDLSLYKGLVDIITELSLDEPFWDKAITSNSQKAESLIIKLGQLADLFKKSCFTITQPHIIFPEKVYTLQKILYLQQIVCRLGHPKSKLGKLTVGKENKKNLFKTFSNAKMQREMERISQANKRQFGDIKIGSTFVVYNTTSKEWSGQSYDPSAATDTIGLELKFHETGSSPSLITFEDFIRKEFPSVIDLIIKNNSEFTRLPKFAQNAHIYSSSFLPDWIKAMRDTHLMCEFLEESSVGSLESLDRQSDLKPCFKIEDKDKHSIVKISFTGVTNDILKQTAVQEIKNKTYLRYASQYPTIANKAISQVTSYLMNRYYNLSEKELINTDIKSLKIDLPNEEIQGLLHLFLNPELQLIEALEYFTKHPEKLKERDYQTLLHVSIFQSNFLEKALAIEGISEKLALFIKQNYEQFKEENEIQTALFLLRMAHQLKDFCPQQDFYCSTLLNLENLLHRQGIEADIKVLIYTELLAQFSHKDKLTENETAILMEGSIYIQENSINSKYSEDPAAYKEACEAVMTHIKQTQELLEKGAPDQALLNRILRTLRPDIKEDQKWTIKVQPGETSAFSTIDNRHTLYPIRSQLISTESAVLLPASMRQNPLFVQLFPNVNYGCYLSGDIYEFEDEQGIKTLVHMKNDHIIVDQKLLGSNGEWYRYIPANMFLGERNSEELVSYLGSRYLTHHYSHWQALDQTSDDLLKIYAKDLKDGQIKYTFTAHPIKGPNLPQEIEKVKQEQLQKLKEEHTKKRGFYSEVIFEIELKDLELQGKYKEPVLDKEASYFKASEVIRLSDHLKLGKPSPIMAKFEDPSYTHEWYDEKGVLVSIELPRFNLSFKVDPLNQDRLTCNQFPNYFLNLKDSIPELGVHHHFILLESKQGQRTVLLPQQTLSAPENREVLLPRYDMDRELGREQTNAQKYLTFEIQKDGKLFNKSREANIYLAYILGTAQEYEKAAYYLRKYGAKLSAYTPSEVSLLEKVATITDITGDKSGNSIVVQLYAQYLLLKNDLSHQKEISKKKLNILANLYELYLNHYRNVTTFKLKPIEETQIARFIEEQALQVSLAKIDRTKNIFNSLHGFKVPEVYVEYMRKPYSHVLLTRTHRELGDHFLYYYELARKGSEAEKQRLKQSLLFMRTTEPDEVNGIANLFEAILENPLAFPDPISSYQATLVNGERAIDKWKQEVESIAINWLTNRKLNHSIPIQNKNLERLTSPHPDKKPFVLPNIQLQYSLPQVPAFSEASRQRHCFTEYKEQEILENTEGLIDLLQTRNKDNPLEEREGQRLLRDLTEYQKQNSMTTYTTTEESLKQAIQILLRDKTNDQKQLESLRSEILELANKQPDLKTQLSLEQIETWGGLRKVMTLEELIVSFARKDLLSLLHRNSTLDESSLNDLGEKIGTYLLYATRSQQRTRSEIILNKLSKIDDKNTPEYKDLINEFAQTMLSERSYNPLERPAYLAFEYFANITMRPSQVEKLEKFLKEGDMNPIMEMIMGSGKSKVLLPLLGLMRADGKNLSMIIVPEPLFESVSQDTQNTLRDAFSQSLQSLSFDRNTQFTKRSLEFILEDLKDIQKSKECLIMTSKSVQCLMLKFIERCAEHFNQSNNDDTLPAELQIMREILTMVSQRGYPLIDEADTALNVLHEVSFSCGNQLSPQVYEVELLSELYALLYEQPELKLLARLETDPNPDLKAPGLTEKLYHEEIKPRLASAFVERLTTMTFESKHLTNKVHTFINQLDKVQNTDLMHYLCRDVDHMTSAQKFYNSLDEEMQNILALAGEQISHLLPYTLTRICDEKYGLEEKSKGVLAIPFSAANTPNSGSQFSNPYITMNYTFQTYMKKGVTTEIIENQIKLLQDQALREIATSGGKIQLKETTAGQIFAKLKGTLDIPLFNYRPVHINELTKRINNSPTSKRNFVTYTILPQMAYFEKKLSCNPQNLVALFNKVAGFTGTLWNGSSMHHKLKAEPELGTDAKTLSILWEHSRTNAISIKEGSTQEMLEQLKTQSISYDMISDAGGYFKQGSNSDIAHKVATINGKEVVFYDKEGAQTITDGHSELPLAQSNKPAEERLTFLDQSHTTGADVPQKRDAISLVTIGRNMLLRDLLQSVWRLRGLAKLQRVRFLISDEVAEIIRQRLGLEKGAAIQFDSILKFVIANQASQQGRDNYKALRQELANLPQQILLTALLNKKLIPKARKQIFKFLETEWIKPSIFSPKELYGTLTTEIESKKVVQEDRKQSLSHLETIFNKMPWLEQLGFHKEQYMQEVELLTKRIENALPAYLQNPPKAIEDDQTVEVEQETQTETEKETELEVQEMVQEGNITIGFVKSSQLKEFPSFAEALKEIDRRTGSESISDRTHGFEKDKCPVFPLKSYLERDNKLNAYTSAFEGIDLSINVLEWTDKKEHFALLGQRRIDFHHLLIKDSKVTILSQEEAIHHYNSADYYNLTLGYNDHKKKPPLDILFKITKVKFLNGESQFSKEEIDLLKQWFAVQGPEKMQKLYLEHILNGYPQKAARYQGSPLQKLFATMGSA